MNCKTTILSLIMTVIFFSGNITKSLAGNNTVMFSPCTDACVSKYNIDLFETTGNYRADIYECLGSGSFADNIFDIWELNGFISPIFSVPGIPEAVLENGGFSMFSCIADVELGFQTIFSDLADALETCILAC